MLQQSKGFFVIICMLDVLDVYYLVKGCAFMKNKMFCFQCQETSGCTGCTMMGVCGKTPAVAAMQDLLIYATKGLGSIAAAKRAAGENVPAEIGQLITENLFITITNVNFDEEAIKQQIDKTLDRKSVV